jgi:hypothetical protein
MTIALRVRPDWSFCASTRLRSPTTPTKLLCITATILTCTWLNTGNGNDIIDSDIVNLIINFGTGTNTLTHATRSSIVNLQGGHNTVRISDDVLVVDAQATDTMMSVAGNVLHGAVGRIGQESTWITGWDGTQYAMNAEGQLGIHTASGVRCSAGNGAGFVQTMNPDCNGLAVAGVADACHAISFGSVGVVFEDEQFIIYSGTDHRRALLTPGIDIQCDSRSAGFPDPAKLWPEATLGSTVLQ